jgi:hypothetical protein
LQLIFVVIASVTATPAAHATAPVIEPSMPRTALGGFVKDSAMARVLGETLFRDTVDVMSDLQNQPTTPPAAAPAVDPSQAAATSVAPASGTANSRRDNSAAGRVARIVLAHQNLDKYLWLIQQAYDDTLWPGSDRARIEQHFPLIWRTSIMLYEATLSASPHRVRVCTPADNGDGFDCRDEIARAKIVPIPSQAPSILPLHQATIG